MTTLGFTTQFNPFGKHEKTIYDLAKNLERRSKKLRADLKESSSKQTTQEVKEFGEMMTELATISKKVEASAVQALLSTMVTPITGCIQVLSESSAVLKQADLAFLCRSICRIIQNMADRIVGPFTSNLLEQWTPLFEILFTSKLCSLRDIGVVLWKTTFGTVTGSLRYSGKLRQAFNKLPRKCGIIFPPEDKAATVLCSSGDEEAMDGMDTTETSSVARQLETSHSQSTFEFSQQPAADEVAEKLLKENVANAAKETEKSRTPSRRRAAKMQTILDEDSCDFVSITATPPSAKKNRLTDRQKEKFAEAAGPRTTINYVDEESQSGFQKKEQINKALTALNYDIGEESVSFLSTSKNVTNHVDSEQSDVKDPVPPASHPTSDVVSTVEDIKSEPLPVKTENHEENDKLDEHQEIVKDEITKIPESTGTPQRRKSARPKKTPKKADVQPTKKRLRSCVSKDDSSSEDNVSNAPKQSANDLDNTAPPAKKKENVADEGNKDATVHEAKQETMEAPKESESDSFSASLINALDDKQKSRDSGEEFSVSPPKTPRTPSILRVSRGFGESPSTDRKRNRVHFGEDSLPQDDPTTPTTPRRKQMMLAVDVKSPSLKESQPTSKENFSLRLLEIEDPFSSTSPFYRGLVGCNDSIDKVVRKLAPMCLKTAVDAVKKSLTKAGVKTIGEFAALSKQQLNDIHGLKHPKEKCARNVLKEYEEMKKEETKVSERLLRLMVTEDAEAIEETSSKSSSKNSIKMEIDEEKPLQPIPKFVESITVPPGVKKTTEGAKSVLRFPIMATKHEETTKSDKGISTSHGSLPVVEETSNASQSVDKALAATGDTNNDAKENNAPAKEKEKRATEKEQTAETTLIDDSRSLLRICSNLSRAHSLGQLSTDKWTFLLDSINKSAILFKSIVVERGAQLSEWDDVDREDDELVSQSELNPEDDVKRLRGVYKRFSRHHTLGDVPDEMWGRVMETVNEAAVLLRSIIVERGVKG